MENIIVNVVSITIAVKVVFTGTLLGKAMTDYIKGLGV